MLRFEPKTEEELNSENTYKPLEMGPYKYHVVKAEEKTSKSQNPMIALDLEIYPRTGKTRYVKDYLMTNHPKMLFKLKHFCDSAGISDQYEKGEISAELCRGKVGFLELGIETSEFEGQRRSRNIVVDYLSSKKEEDSDDIPF